jgi:hypothetical protein
MKPSLFSKSSRNSNASPDHHVQILEATIVASSTKPRRGRKPHIKTIIELPIPPSVNALWFNAPGRGRVRTDEYRAWLKEAGWLLKEQRVARIPGAVGLQLLVGIPKRRRVGIWTIR